MKAVSEETAAANLQDAEEALDFYPFAEGLKALTLDNEAGEIEVVVLDAEDDEAFGVTVRRDVFDPQRHRMELKRRGDAVTFSCGHREASAKRGECRVDLTVFIPKGVEVAIDQGQGGVCVKGLQKPLIVRMGQGRVLGKRLSGPVKIDLGQGRVALDYGECDGALGGGPRRIACNVGQGEIEIKVPSEAKVSSLISLPYGSEKPKGLVSMEDEPDFILEGSLANGSFKLDR